MQRDVSALTLQHVQIKQKLGILAHTEAGCQAGSGPPARSAAAGGAAANPDPGSAGPGAAAGGAASSSRCRRAPAATRSAAGVAPGARVMSAPGARPGPGAPAGNAASWSHAPERERASTSTPLPEQRTSVHTNAQERPHRLSATGANAFRSALQQHCLCFRGQALALWSHANSRQHRHELHVTACFRCTVCARTLLRMQQPARARQTLPAKLGRWAPRAARPPARGRRPACATRCRRATRRWSRGCPRGRG